MNTSPLFLHSYQLDTQQVITDEAQAKKLIHDKTLAWVHLDVAHPKTAAWLEGELTYLDPHITSALLAEETRPRLSEIGDGMLLILRGVNLNEDADPEDMVSIRIWVDPHRIISVQRRSLKAVESISRKIQKGNGPTNSQDFVAALVRELLERMEPTIQALDDKIDAIEEDIIDSPDAALRDKVSKARKQAIMLRRHLSPQRDVIMQLRNTKLAWFSAHQRSMHESYDRITRFIEDLDAMRERAQIIKDEIATALADKLNKNTYILTIVAAVFLPLGFLTGLLGVNVGGIPGAENNMAFALFCGICVLIMVIQIWVFKKLKWF